MPLGHCSSIYLYVYILTPSLYLDCVYQVVVELLDYMGDIAAQLELEAQAFRYTRNNIC